MMMPATIGESVIIERNGNIIFVIGISLSNGELPTTSLAAENQRDSVIDYGL